MRACTAPQSYSPNLVLHSATVINRATKKIIVTATLQHTEFYMVDRHIVQKRITQAYDFPFYCVLIVFIAATTLLTQEKPRHTEKTRIK